MIISVPTEHEQVTRPDDVHKLLQVILAKESRIDQDKEHFWVLLLDNRQRIRVLDLVTLGLVNQSLVHPREVFTRAIAHRCSSIIIAHNHPSGIVRPSDEDIRVTERLQSAGDIIDIKVIDHIITTTKDYYSFKQEGLL